MLRNVQVSTSRWMVKALGLGGLLALGIGLALACSDEEPVGSGSEPGTLAGPPGVCPYSAQFEAEYDKPGHRQAAENMCRHFSREEDPEREAKIIAQFCSFEAKHGNPPFVGGPCAQEIQTKDPEFVLGPGAEGGGFAFGFCGKKGCRLVFENGDAGLDAPPNFDAQGGGYFLGQSNPPCSLDGVPCGPPSTASRVQLAGGFGGAVAQFEEQVHWETTAQEPFEFKLVKFGLCVWLPEGYEPVGEIRVAKNFEGDEGPQGQPAGGVFVFDPIPFGLPCLGGPTPPVESEGLRVPALSGSAGTGSNAPALSGKQPGPSGLKLAGGLGGASSSASDWGIVDFVEGPIYSE
jgi:hypothetical protein